MEILVAAYAVSVTTAYVAVYPTTVITYCGIWITREFRSNLDETRCFYLQYFVEVFYEFREFRDKNIGLAVGDRESGYFEIYTTANGGTSWTRVPQENLPALMKYIPQTARAYFNFRSDSQNVRGSSYN